MAAYRSVRLMCDGARCLTEYIPTDPTPTASAARYLASRRGWTTVARRDYCPACCPATANTTAKEA
ncbi:hypothetical protein GCM10022243_49030 [Saccharothrix violaceirubra]|uniref:Uncharacterized protein n=1 Tax=Saccharothrix violaceirubra TaxID=413306 RepID=A0A7W7WU22_9PSEU|nr:hypothetical protein [Saccharothrix violaceirubra]